MRMTANMTSTRITKRPSPAKKVLIVGNLHISSNTGASIKPDRGLIIIGIAYRPFLDHYTEQIRIGTPSTVFRFAGIRGQSF